jgi:hypothetical protein
MKVSGLQAVTGDPHGRHPLKDLYGETAKLSLLLLYLERALSLAGAGNEVVCCGDVVTFDVVERIC